MDSADNGFNRTMDWNAVNVHLLWWWACIAIVSWASHTSKRRSRESAFIPTLSFPPANGSRLRLAALDGFGGFYIWWERVWSMKRGRRLVGSDASRLGNWEFQWLVRDCGQISDRSFFTRPSRKSRTKIRNGSRLNAILECVSIRERGRRPPVVPPGGSRGFAHCGIRINYDDLSRAE